MSLLSHITFGSSNTPSSAIDTTGATILFIACASNIQNTPTDSKGNTWNLVSTITQTGNNLILRTYAAYGAGLVVGTGHTATMNGSGSGYMCSFVSFSGFTGPVDKSNAAVNAFAATQQTGSITPSSDGMLIFTAFGESNHGPATGVDSGISIIDNSAGGGSGIGTGYVIQGTAAAINPTWTDTTAGFLAANIASFPALSSGSIPELSLLGAG